MKKAYIPNRFISNVIALPPGVLGHLDWTTGAVRMNLTFEEYENIKDSNDWLQYQEVLLHEFYHGLQICSSGYLYNFIVEFTYQLWEFGVEMDSEELNMKRKFYEPIILTNEIKDALVHLNDKKGGLSIVDIVESSAFVSHNLMFHNDYDLSSFLQDRIKYSTYDTPYFTMYNYLERYLGENSFYLIPSLSFYCLLFSEPIRALNVIVERLAKKELSILEETISNLDDIVKEIKKDIPYLGTPIHSLSKKQLNYLHPFYSKQIKDLRQLLSFEYLALITSNSRYISTDIFDACLRPIIFNCSVVCFHEDYSSAELKKINIDKQLESLKVMNALSYKAFNDYNIGLSFFKPIL